MKIDHWMTKTVLGTNYCMNETKEFIASFLQLIFGTILAITN